jgi:hypothetical protein
MIVSAFLALLEWGVAAVGVGAFLAALVTKNPIFFGCVAVALFGAAMMRGLAMTRHLNRTIEHGIVRPSAQAGTCICPWPEGRSDCPVHGKRRVTIAGVRS